MSINQLAIKHQLSEGKRSEIESVFKKLPVPIIHNKRLGEIVYGLMIQVPGLRCRHRKAENLDIITCHDYPATSLLEKSLDYLGIEGYTVLREPFDGPWRNTFKLKWLLNYLERYPYGPPNVLFCDADDAIVVGDPTKILEVFERKRCKLLFMSTSFMGGYACMPEIKRWTDKIRPGRYLNSGVYIGRRDFLVTVLRAANEYITANDITAQESRNLGHGVFNTKLCERVPDYPKGSQDQDILRYIHPQFFPDMQIDFDNELAFRNL
jgi:hypothetical protein